MWSICLVTCAGERWEFGSKAAVRALRRLPAERRVRRRRKPRISHVGVVVLEHATPRIAVPGAVIRGRRDDGRHLERSARSNVLPPQHVVSETDQAAASRSVCVRQSPAKVTRHWSLAFHRVTIICS